MPVKFTFKGFERVDRAMVAMSKGFSNGMLMDQVGQEMVKMVQHRIAVEKESPDGSPWPANKDGTSTLYRTGGLWGSIQYTAGLNDVTVGTSWPYAHIHQNGATIVANRMTFRSGGHWWRTGKVVIPARPFMGLSENNINEIDKIVRNYLFHIIPRDVWF